MTAKNAGRPPATKKPAPAARSGTAARYQRGDAPAAKPKAARPAPRGR